MPVYKQTYKDYSGTRTTPWFRFLILSRYSYARLFQSENLFDHIHPNLVLNGLYLAYSLNQ